MLKDHHTAIKPSLPSMRKKNDEERLETNQRDNSYIQTIVDGHSKQITRSNNLYNYNDSCSMI